jgi:thiol-disulfide isomerase/thioredoxin
MKGASNVFLCAAVVCVSGQFLTAPVVAPLTPPAQHLLAAGGISNSQIFAATKAAAKIAAPSRGLVLPGAGLGAHGVVKTDFVDAASSNQFGNLKAPENHLMNWLGSTSAESTEYQRPEISRSPLVATGKPPVNALGALALVSLVLAVAGSQWWRKGSLATPPKMQFEMQNVAVASFFGEAVNAALAASQSSSPENSTAAGDSIKSAETPHGASKVTAIQGGDELNNFATEDERLCVVKFYAKWCKSCARYDVKYRKFAHDHGDLYDENGILVHKGSMRFGEVEFSTNKELCKAIGIKKLPFVQIYKAKHGKLTEFVSTPKTFEEKFATRMEGILAMSDDDISFFLKMGDDQGQMIFSSTDQHPMAMSSGGMGMVV